VVREGGGRDGEGFAQIGAGGAGLGGNIFQNVKTAWVGESPGDRAYLARRQFGGGHRFYYSRLAGIALTSSQSVACSWTATDGACVAIGVA